jgi:hypothetical protein
MAHIKCDGCGEIVVIPAELCPDPETVEITEPYYCDACDREAESAVAASMGDDYDDGREYCHHCGKDIYDWSDLGCEYCDRRHPHYGVYP